MFHGDQHGYKGCNKVVSGAILFQGVQKFFKGAKMLQEEHKCCKGCNNITRVRKCSIVPMVCKNAPKGTVCNGYLTHLYVAQDMETSVVYTDIISHLHH